MTTIAGHHTVLASERRFFLIMALVIAATVFLGFGMNFQRNAWAFASLPLYVHLHGAVFTFWILLYVLQNWLVANGSVTIHRQLGMLGAGVAATMVVLGIATTMLAVVHHRVPGFFPSGVFLVLDVVGVLGFGVLTGWAIRLRHQAAWHKRLMLCGTILVMSPAIGRILPMPLLGRFAGLAVFTTMALYVIAGMAFDLKSRGRVHPAYWWGGGVLVATQVVIGALGFSRPVLWMVERLAA